MNLISLKDFVINLEDTWFTQLPMKRKKTLKLKGIVMDLKMESRKLHWTGRDTGFILLDLD